jgi:predicted HTH transcriptional regulator
VTRSTPHKTNKVAFKTVRFRPDSNLKGHFVGVRANQSKYVRHSEKVSEVEIDMLLKEYFAEHQMMTRRDFQEVCGLARTTAKTHLVRLRGEGKLVNIGLRNQPMYVPAPGYYGVSRDAAHPSR